MELRLKKNCPKIWLENPQMFGKLVIYFYLTHRSRTITMDIEKQFKLNGNYNMTTCRIDLKP